MTDPLAPLARWANSVMRTFGLFVGDKVLALVSLPVFGLFWGGLAFAIRTVAPHTAIAHWFDENWPWMIAGTVVILSVYWFIRNMLDTKTGD